MARRPDYAFSLCMALEMAAMLHQLRREPEQVAELATEMQTLAVQGGLPYRQATAGVLLGWARSALGNQPRAAAISKQRWAATDARGPPANCRTS
jgi:hypothetical protein